MSREPYEFSEIACDWIKSVGLNDIYLKRRLNWDDLSSEDALSIFELKAEEPSPPQFAAIQEWLRDSPSIADCAENQRFCSASFLELWQRIADRAMNRLLKEIESEILLYYGLSASTHERRDGIYGALYDSLVIKLSQIAEPVLCQEFNERRTPDQIIFAHLGTRVNGVAQVKRSTYCQFLEQARSDGLSRIVQKYPVLKRHLSTAVEQWTNSCYELLLRV